MGRHKETYGAKWQAHRQVTIGDQETIRIPLEIQSGDRGRPVALTVTMQELESLVRSANEALHRHRVEQLRRENGKREFELMQQVWDQDRRIKELDQRTKELEGVIERVHEVVHPDRPEAVDLSDRPNVVHSPSNVAH